MTFLRVIMAYTLLVGQGYATLQAPDCQANLEHSRQVNEACQALVAAQDQSILNLKASVKDLDMQLKQTKEPQFLGFIPNWAWLALGTGFGLYIGTHLR